MKKTFLLALWASLMLLTSCRSNRAPGMYWVSPTGNAAWSTCQGSSPAVSCSLATANTNAQAGDTVMLRGGTYNFSTNYAVAIGPSKSGVQGSPITFRAYNGEVPEFLSVTPYQDRTCVNLNNKSWIKIDGIQCHNFFRWLQIQNYSHHNEVLNSKFYSDTGEESAINNLIIGLVIAGQCPTSGNYNCYSTHNWIHNNVFEKAHGYTTTTCLEGADILRIGYPYGTGNDAGLNNFNTIENNTARYAGHAVFDQYGLYNVIKNNDFSNPPWWQSRGPCTNPADYTDDSLDGKYGHRVMQVTRNFPDPDTYVLVEGNKLSLAGINPANDGAENLDLAAASIITRYNDIYGAMGAGIMFKYAYSLRDKVYSNTLNHNGYGYPYFWSCTSSICPTGGYSVEAYDTTQRVGSIVINNILYDSARYGLEKNETGLKSGKQKPNNGLYFTEGKNWYTATGDPKLASDFSLQLGSPAIDKGTWLTVATNGGDSSTVLTVQDALFFQDGSWGSDLARGVTHFPDWIAIGKVTNTVQIVKIDYPTNTITLSSGKTWSSADPIWLARKSDGKIVLQGSAPDFGAHESTPIVAPNNSGRIYDQALTQNENGAYQLPDGATKVTCYRDGLRVVDYQIMSGVLVPNSSWPSTAQILIDYDTK